MTKYLTKCTGNEEADLLNISVASIFLNNIHLFDRVAGFYYNDGYLIIYDGITRAESRSARYPLDKDCVLLPNNIIGIL